MAGITHIKNPLTIIGIFASLVEVMGIGFMPKMDREVQLIYVWFLMFFPIGLVGAFFFVLYYKHKVLYAPSDFREDRSFNELVRSDLSPAAPASIEEKRNEELEQIVEVAPMHVHVRSRTREAAPVDSPPAAEKKIEPPISQPRSINAPESSPLEAAELKARFAESYVVGALSQQHSLKFDREVNYRGSNYVFDAIAVDKDRVVAVEVKYTRNGLLKPGNIERLFTGANFLYAALPPERRDCLEFIIALVTEPETQSDKNRITRSCIQIREFSKNFPFKTTIRVFDWGEIHEGVTLPESLRHVAASTFEAERS